MQVVYLHGYLGRDAEIIKVGDKEQVKFSLACTEGKGDKKYTTWYDVLSYATGLQPYLLKGKDVIVTGRLSVRQTQGKDGKTYVNINVYADAIELCGGRNDAAPTPAPQPTRQAPQPKQQSQTIFVGDDDMPF